MFRTLWTVFTVTTLLVSPLANSHVWAQASGPGTGLLAPGVRKGPIGRGLDFTRRLRDATFNRKGRTPGLERKPPLKAIADPANLESDVPAIKAAAEVKQQEDLKDQKIKAVKYLAKIGCGCYDDSGKVTEALVAAMEDCTEEVRLETIKAIEKALDGSSCDACNEKSCCNMEIAKQLALLAYGKNDKGCWVEPSARVRGAAANTLQACCSNPRPLRIVPTQQQQNGGDNGAGRLEGDVEGGGGQLEGGMTYVPAAPYIPAATAPATGYFAPAPNMVTIPNMRPTANMARTPNRATAPAANHIAVAPAAPTSTIARLRASHVQQAAAVNTGGRVVQAGAPRVRINHLRSRTRAAGPIGIITKVNQAERLVDVAFADPLLTPAKGDALIVIDQAGIKQGEMEVIDVKHGAGLLRPLDDTNLARVRRGAVVR